MAIIVRENVQLSPLTTFGIGGPARYFTDVAKEADVREALRWAQERNIAYVLVAGGSNIVVPDDGLDALVLHIVEGEWSLEGGVLNADFGCDLLALIRACGARSYGGGGKNAGVSGTVRGGGGGDAGGGGRRWGELGEG